MSGSQQKRSQRDHFLTVVDHEIRTLLRTPALVALGVAFGVLVVAAGWLGGTSAYVPLSLALLTPLEILIPALVVAFAYRAILNDREHGELAVLQMYPVSDLTYVIGVYVGRLVALLVVVLVPTFLAGLLVPVTGTEADPLATHTGLDSPVLYLRFVVLTGLFTAVVTGVIIALSSMARTSRQGFALALALVIGLSIGFDLAVIGGMASGLLSNESLWVALAVSPNSAYRGLVMAMVVEPVTVTESIAAPPLANIVSLSVWLLGSIYLAIRSL